MPDRYAHGLVPRVPVAILAADPVLAQTTKKELAGGAVERAVSNASE
jgi:hypothetical protein